VFDVLRRWLTVSGYQVTIVANVTDIDDKILAKSAEAGVPWFAHAYHFERELHEAYASLGCEPPTYEPRATGHIPEMLELVAELIEAGHAYAAADETGDVYFDVKSWPSYGELSNQRVDDMVPAEDSDPRGKRDPRDFALWKGYKESEPYTASWPSPWGRGRPGWHLECSAMAMKYLGTEFDIHGGGLDLRFPHHENELAQSTAAGDAFANYWVHNGLVNTNGQKMSKSLGNSVYAAELLDQARPIVVRYYLGAAHYRSTLDFHEGSLAEAEAALERIESFLDRADRRLADTRFAGSGVEIVPDDFATAMDDDLAVPQALGVLHDTVRAGNAALDAEDLHAAAAARGQVLAMSEVLGINPLSPGWAVATDEPAMVALTALVERLLDDRETARQSRDYAAADRIRDELVAAGITIEDTPSGAHWSFD
jgi:cysteinyl-tRNA synthetase